MKTIIAGHREFTDLALMTKILKYVPWDITATVCGCAPGADSTGKVWAQNNKLPTDHFPADWDKYKKAAGPIRNREMEKVGQALVAFLAPGSKGTKDMIEVMRAKRKPIFIWYLDTNTFRIEMEAPPPKNFYDNPA